MSKLLVLFAFLFAFISCKDNSFDKKNKGYVLAVIGSSTAAGACLENPNESWVNMLASYLPNIRVINYAKGGYTTYHFMPLSFSSNLADRPIVDASRNIDMVLKSSPSILIISLPSNDIAYGYSQQEYLNNIEYMYDYAQTHGVSNVLVSTTQPRNLSIDKRNQLWACKNTMFDIYKNDVVDFWSPLCGNERLLNTALEVGDGIHPNAEGHRLLFFQIKQKIDSILVVDCIE